VFILEDSGWPGLLPFHMSYLPRKVKIFSRCSNICFHITCTGKLDVHFRLFLQIDNRLLMPDAVLLSQTSIG